MARNAIPEDILRFVADSIDSVPHMETLLLLSESADTVWSEEDVARRIYISTDRARSILQDLVRRKFIVSTAPQSPECYRYDTGWDAGQMMPRLAACYRRNLVELATFIHSKASLAVRDFARAFQLKDK